MVILLNHVFYARVTINFVERDGETVSVKAKLGETLLDVAKDNDISLEGILIYLWSDYKFMMAY